MSRVRNAFLSRPTRGSSRLGWLLASSVMMGLVCVVSMGWAQVNENQDAGVTGGTAALSSLRGRDAEPGKVASAQPAPVLAAARTTFDEMLAYHLAHPNVQPVVIPFMKGPGPQIVPFADEAAATADAGPSLDREGADAQFTPTMKETESPAQRVQATELSAPLAPPVLTDFQGVVDNNTVIPPDTMGAVGPNHVVEILNTGFTVFDRSGTLVAPQVSLAAFWSSLGGAFANGSFDPKILYDQHSGRWVVVADTNAFSVNSAVLVGISATGDPTGGYNLFAIDADPGDTTWADFPGLGVDTANVYVSNNMFDSVAGFFVVTKFWVIDKASMSAGPLSVAAITESVGGFTWQPGHSFDNVPTGLNYVISQGWSIGARRFLRIQRFNGVGVATTLTDLGFIEVDTYNFIQAGAPQLSTTTTIATNDTRLLNAVVRMDTIYTTGSVGDSAGKTEVAWYEVDPSLANQALTNGPNQQGRVSDPSLFYYFPSIAVNKDKCVALGFSGSDASSFVSGYFTAHLPASAPGSTLSVGLLHAGAGSYVKIGGGSNRWGDYSATVVDPVDDLTFWSLQEYAEAPFAGGLGKWATWWNSFVCVPESAPEVKFSQPPIGNGEDIASNIDWVDEIPNVVVADDFVSDGRPITAVRWWGSDLSVAALPFCGDNVVNQASEDCDGTDDAACPGQCQAGCTCPGNQPSDDCNQAPTASEGAFPFSNLGATTDGPDEFPICDFFGDTNVASDVWVCYNPTCSGIATASLCGSGYDTKIAVYDGCTCPLVPSAIACNDDACGFQSEVSFPVTAGQSRLLRIGGFSGDQGTGTLTISCTPGGGGGGLFASDPTGANLGTVDSNTGLFTVIGSFTGAAANITEIEWSPDGTTLYAGTGGGASTLHTVDATTGTILSSVAHAFGALQGMEFDASGNLLGTLAVGPGGVNPSELVRIDPNTGVTTVIGPTGFNAIGGLAFDASFTTLFGITSGGSAIPPTLLSVNPGTGAAVAIALTTMPAEASSLEFTSTGKLVAGGADSILYQINTTTGVATAIGPLVNAGKVSGLSVRPQPCSMTNGGFETGDFTGWTAITGPGIELEPWTVTSGGTGWFGNGFPVDGAFFAQNGFDGDAGLFYDIYQEVAIPAGTASAVLDWSERIQWDLTFGASVPRTYEVTLQPAGGGSPLAILFSMSLPPGTISNPPVYAAHSIDLLTVAPAIAGSTVRINWHQTIPESFTGPAQFDFDAATLNCTTLLGEEVVVVDLLAPNETRRQAIDTSSLREADPTPSFEELRANYASIREKALARTERLVGEPVVGVLLDVQRRANVPRTAGLSRKAASTPPQMDPAGDVPEAPAYEEIQAVATQRAAAPPFAPTPIGGGIWIAQGPTKIEFGQVENIPPTNDVVGAAHTVAAHPTDPNILYMGAVNGGVWKTTNATGANPTWTPQTDFVSSLSIGALEFDPTDSTNNTLVAGIGRFSSFGRRGGARTGLLHTTDGGSNWAELDGGGILVGKNISGVAARGSILVVSVNTADPFTCTNIGIFRSTNTGVTFSQVSGAGGSGLPRGRVFDLVGDPTNAAVLYASVRDTLACSGSAVNGIYRSTDTGATWTRVSDATMNAMIIDVSPFTSNVEMAVGNSNNVFVGIANGGQLAGLFRSGDGGISWTSMDLPMTAETGGNMGLHVGGQASIHFSILADPFNSFTVYLGGDRQPAGFNDLGGFPNAIGAFNFTGRLFRCNINAAPGTQCVHLTHSNSLGLAGGGTAGSSAPHADSREMVFDANGDIVQVDDGGIYVRTSPQNNSGDWFSIIGAQWTEFHDIAYDTLSNSITGGTQDTGSILTIPAIGMSWDTINQGDGGDVAVDVISAAPNSIHYTSAQFLLSFQRITRNSSGFFVAGATPALVTVGGGTPLVIGGGGNVQFVTPIELNAIDPTRLIIGGATSVYESLDRGDTVREIGPGIGVNRPDAIAYGGRKGGISNLTVLYVGSGNTVFASQMPPAPLLATAPLPSPGLCDSTSSAGCVGDIVLDPDDWAIAYVIDTDQVFFTVSIGTSWTDITGNLTGVGLLRSIEFIPGSDDIVVVGADAGVFISLSSALGTWNELGTNLPNAPAYDLDYDPVDDVLVVGTLGRGAWIANGPFVPGVCGDNMVNQANETCDGTDLGILGCTSCRLSTDLNNPCTCCGDGIVQATSGEQCEPPNTGVCDANCQPIFAICGDNTVNQAGETCDGMDLGILGCTSCRLSTDPNDPCTCCGDGIVQSTSGEQCEPPNVGACDANCQSTGSIEPDGWFISFHEPLVVGGPPLPPLALYFCDTSLVLRQTTTIPACDGHPVIEYNVDLANCCLVHANPDSRNGNMPAEKDAFFEDQCFDYAIDIQAAIGHKFTQDPITMECIETLTGNSIDTDIWGWHTTGIACGAGFSPALQPALMTSVSMVGLDWLYGPWTPVSPVCSQPNMAFELLTTAPQVTSDADGNCIPDVCDCIVSGAPDPELGLVSGGGTGTLTATRTLNFTVPDNGGRRSAIRIELKEIPPALLASNPPGNIPDSFLGLVGAQMWVSADPSDTQNLCSIPSIGFGGLCPVICVLGADDGNPCTVDSDCAAPGTCVATPTIQMTALSQTAGFLDWSTQGDLHIYGSTIGAGANFIIPGALYEVTVLAEDCDPADPASFSPPLTLGGLKPGDVVGVLDVGAGVWTIPGDGASITSDVPALLSAFKGEATAANKARMDIQGTNTLQRAQLDGIIGLNDVNDGIDGFKGKLYSFGPGLCIGGSQNGIRGCDPADPVSTCVLGGGVCTFDCPAVTCPCDPAAPAVGCP